MTNLDGILKSIDITLPTKVCIVKAMVFLVVMYGCESWTIKRLSIEKLMLLNSGVGEDSWESLGQQGDQTSPSWRRSGLNIHWKDWCWSWNFNTLATWLEELIHLKRPWCWERLKVGGKGDNRGSDDWMVSLTPRTWVWASSRSWWRTAKPGMLQAMGSDTKSWTRLSDWTKLNVHWLWSHFLLIPQLKPVTSDLFTLLQLLTMRLQASSEQFIDFSDCSFFFKTYSSKSFPKTLPS